jgi:hypothetical protein
MWLRVGGVLAPEISKQRNALISKGSIPKNMCDSLTIPDEDTTFFKTSDRTNPAKKFTFKDLLFTSLHIHNLLRRCLLF